MITVKQAAKILCLKAAMVSLLCRAGQIEGAVKIGRDWMIPSPPRYINRRPRGRPFVKDIQDSQRAYWRERQRIHRTKERE